MAIRLLGVSCGLLHWGICRGSFGSCLLGSGASTDQTWSDARSDWVSGNLEAGSTPWALERHWGVPLQWVGILGPQWCLDGQYVSSGIHIFARTQGFLAKHYIVTKLWVLFISPVKGFNVVADWCKCVRSDLDHYFSVHDSLSFHLQFLYCKLDQWIPTLHYVILSWEYLN